jgi:phosphomannomutase
MPDTLALARAFLAEDPDADSRAALAALVKRVEAGEAAARRELGERFAAPLAFGTAGLRGKVEAGLARMNRVVVSRATWGLGTWLIEASATGGPDPRARGVALGFDGRYSSREFAEDAAAVLAGLGIPVHLFADPVPTPLLSFATARAGAAAGVMVTASHNPPADNGYKVYLASGAQIVPPYDTAIAACIDRAPAFAQIARPAPADAAAAGRRRLLDVREAAVETAYLDGIAAGCVHAEAGPPLRIAYTAMHGVGHRLVLRALARAGFEGVAVVPAQADPDGAFRTVSFPNPEEPGAMDRVLALAAEAGAELVIANDPDADRLAVAVPGASGDWHQLSGNDVGALLGADLIEHADTGGRRKLVVTTIVSSSLLSRIARDAGAVCRETLTGFKWIAQAALAGERDGLGFVFGYEEALGYCPGRLVLDKDGISSAVRVCELARHLKGSGLGLLDQLERLLVRHGLSHQVQWSVTLPGASGQARIAAAMAELRRRPLAAIAGRPVVRVLDVLTGEERVGRESRLCGLPSSDVLAFHTEDGSRLTVRPSGTEPKIKFYLELAGRAQGAGELAAARAALETAGKSQRAELVRHLDLA